MHLKYKYIAVDFDGTIVHDCYPEIGKLIDGAKETLVQIREAGGEIIIWTCREGLDKEACIDFMKNMSIPFDYINCNHPDLIKKFGNDCRKIGAEVYIDDKSLLGQEINWSIIKNFLFCTTKKPMFRVELPVVEHKYLRHHINGGIYFSRFIEDVELNEIQFTESEIRAIDDGYWQFAVPVEEGEG
ncbi:hypothetical protein BMT55_00005 [Listeria newyorkensis]|uniref:Uncharacterized protein n=1 Tax=Listeria newyorkensis TaxID=1497681 RepID=A0ABX4XRY1_9LIST|nr:DUF1642 domain-containing protein [Listeria newyorkensis]PNP94776.1 hypothetical protein BMT55_00005 [Listeria newyorkensis]